MIKLPLGNALLDGENCANLLIAWNFIAKLQSENIKSDQI